MECLFLCVRMNSMDKVKIAIFVFTHSPLQPIMFIGKLWEFVSNNGVALCLYAGAV